MVKDFLAKRIAKLGGRVATGRVRYDKFLNRIKKWRQFIEKVIKQDETLAQLLQEDLKYIDNELDYLEGWYKRLETEHKDASKVLSRLLELEREKVNELHWMLGVIHKLKDLSTKSKSVRLKLISYAKRLKKFAEVLPYKGTGVEPDVSYIEAEAKMIESFGKDLELLSKAEVARADKIEKIIEEEETYAKRFLNKIQSEKRFVNRFKSLLAKVEELNMKVITTARGL